MSTLLAGLVDAAVVLALALAAMIPLRRRSAALRHAILSIAIVIAALMPAIEWLVPPLPIVRWYDPVVTVASNVTMGSPGAALTAGDTTVTGDQEFAWVTLATSIWVVGAVVIGAGLITSLIRTSRMRRQCTPVTGRWRELADDLLRQEPNPPSVTLVQSRDTSLLVTCGRTSSCPLTPPHGPMRAPGSSLPTSSRTSPAAT